MSDHDGDGILTLIDEGAKYTGVSIALTNLEEDHVFADLDKRQLLKWCEMVTSHLRKQGVKPDAMEPEGYVSTKEVDLPERKKSRGST
ncbi:hypothetical protein [Ralstonia pseudosolanacearum]|uniref:hypothetical protein n=1 Tax=Ralstonia pseudosolanacearum TaxID=1310165 RepID=UPI003CEE44B9